MTVARISDIFRAVRILEMEKRCLQKIVMSI